MLASRHSGAKLAWLPGSSGGPPGSAWGDERSRLAQNGTRVTTDKSLIFASLIGIVSRRHSASQSPRLLDKGTQPRMRQFFPTHEDKVELMG